MDKSESQTSNEEVSVFDQFDHTVESVIDETDRLIEPVRRSAFRRFPILFLLLTTFGAAATLYGLELMISDVPFLLDRPWLIVLLGVAVLAATGKLYKKLG